MLEGDRNGRNIAAMSWRKTIQVFKRHGEKNGCYVIEVPPAGTTKRCSQCGTETAKPLWVREHSCPACGFEADRDYNAALEIKRRGLEELGIKDSTADLGQGMAESTPAETALPGESTQISSKRVVETGNPTLKERTAAAVSE
jgi:putative transposase